MGDVSHSWVDLQKLQIEILQGLHDSLHVYVPAQWQLANTIGTFTGTPI